MKDLITKYIVLLCTVFSLVSCNQSDDEIMPSPIDEEPTAAVPLNFNARVKENVSFKVGDTVKFVLEGNSDLVSFYSGGRGNDFAFRDKERFFDVLANLNFQSSKTPINSNNVDCAKLVYSNDFNGIYTYANVMLATWKPLTDKFYLQTQLQLAATDFAESGIADVSEVFVPGKPVYFAWYCTTAAGSLRTQFRVQNFKLQGVVPDDPTLSGELYSQLQFGFKWVLNDAAAAQTSSLPTVTSTALVWNGIFTNTTGPFKDGYAVSAPLTLPQFNAGKDMPTIIITKQKLNQMEHKYVYAKAGEYDVVFIASKLNSGSPQEITKKVHVSITN